MNNPFPWYDSQWLAAYWQALRFIEREHPEKVSGFIAAFEGLYTSGNFETQRIASPLSANEYARLIELINRIEKNTLETHELLLFGRHVAHDIPLVSAIQQRLVDKVSALVGEPVVPSYSFLSLYNNLGICELHLDAPEAKWTLDICLDQSNEWPIYLSKPQSWPKPQGYENGWDERIKRQVGFDAYVMEPRQALLFSGSSQWHYRDRMPQTTVNNYSHLLFLHYVPAAAVNIVNPAHWAKYFDVPALAEVINYECNSAVTG